MTRGRKSNKWLRKNIFPTVLHSEKLLDRLRFGDRLSEVERQAVWVLLSDTAYSAAKKHYGQAQVYGGKLRDRPREWYELPDPDRTYDGEALKYYEAHTDRMLVLVEWLKSRKDMSAGWCIVAWKRRFSQFEELRHFRSIGIHIDVKDVQKREIRDAVFINQLSRRCKLSGQSDNNTLYKAWLQGEEEAGRKVTPKRVENFFKRLDHYNALMQRTKHARSYEAYSSNSNVL